MSPDKTAIEKRKTPCCGYEFQSPDPGPIFWNPYNAVVQCHHCGAAFDERKTAISEAEGEQLRAIEDLAMLVRRMVVRLRQHEDIPGDQKLADQANGLSSAHRPSFGRLDLEK